MTPAANTYIYPVQNGEIHRYAGTLWSSDYANAFMMDRNLGAIAAESGEEPVKTYGLYYQWGRKDPFKSTGSVTTVAIDGTGAPGEGIIKQNIRYSIHHPNTFLGGYGSNWTAYETTGVILGSSTAAWNDSKTHSEDSEKAGFDRCEAGKSIYDPCPYGWQVPKNGAWSDFDASNTEWSSAPAGRYYYPKGNAANGRVWYASSGDISFLGGREWVEKNGDIWSSTPYSSSNSYYTTVTANGVTVSGTQWGMRAYGFSVRCIRTSYTTPY